MEVERALPEMQRLASRIWSREARHHPGQLSWSVYYGEDLELGPVELVRVGGEVVGWAWAESDDVAGAVRGPGASRGRRRAWSAWFLDRAPVGDVTTMVLETEQHVLGRWPLPASSPATSRGSPTTSSTSARWRRCRASTVTPSATSGPARPSERAACHRAAWSGDVARDRHGVRTADGERRYYRHDLDWVAVDDGGEMVASVWPLARPDTGVALVEPVGCVPEHRGRGLAGAVSLAAAPCGREAGAINGAGVPARRRRLPGARPGLPSIGFRPGPRTVTLTRPEAVGHVAASRPDSGGRGLCRSTRAGLAWGHHVRRRQQMTLTRITSILGAVVLGGVLVASTVRRAGGGPVRSSPDRRATTTAGSPTGPATSRPRCRTSTAPTGCAWACTAKTTTRRDAHAAPRRRRPGARGGPGRAVGRGAGAAARRTTRPARRTGTPPTSG